MGKGNRPRYYTGVTPHSVPTTVEDCAYIAGFHVWHKDRLAEKPPVVRNVQRKAFAATLSAPIPLLHEDFYKKDPLLLDDLLRKYCACAVALLSASAGTGDVLTASGTSTDWFWAADRHTKDRGPVV